jgi:D-hexose-6-phosphate mutarotase
MVYRPVFSGMWVTVETPLLNPHDLGWMTPQVNRDTPEVVRGGVPSCFIGTFWHHTRGPDVVWW